jgi:hypothetical protein
LGNKGAVAIYVTIGLTNMLIVNAHLAAHQDAETQRNIDFDKINRLMPIKIFDKKAANNNSNINIDSNFHSTNSASFVGLKTTNSIKPTLLNSNNNSSKNNNNNNTNKNNNTTEMKTIDTNIIIKNKQSTIEIETIHEAIKNKQSTIEIETIHEAIKNKQSTIEIETIHEAIKNKQSTIEIETIHEAIEKTLSKHHDDINDNNIKNSKNNDDDNDYFQIIENTIKPNNASSILNVKTVKTILN